MYNDTWKSYNPLAVGQIPCGSVKRGVYNNNNGGNNNKVYFNYYMFLFKAGTGFSLEYNNNNMAVIIITTKTSPVRTRCGEGDSVRFGAKSDATATIALDEEGGRPSGETFPMGPKENNRPGAKKAEKFVSRVSVCVFLMSPYDTNGTHTPVRKANECSGADFRARDMTAFGAHGGSLRETET